MVTMAPTTPAGPAAPPEPPLAAATPAVSRFGQRKLLWLSGGLGGSRGLAQPAAVPASAALFFSETFASLRRIDHPAWAWARGLRLRRAPQRLGLTVIVAVGADRCHGGGKGLPSAQACLGGSASRSRSSPVGEGTAARAAGGGGPAWSKVGRCRGAGSSCWLRSAARHAQRATQGLCNSKYFPRELSMTSRTEPRSRRVSRGISVSLSAMSRIVSLLGRSITIISTCIHDGWRHPHRSGHWSSKHEFEYSRPSRFFDGFSRSDYS